MYAILLYRLIRRYKPFSHIYWQGYCALFFVFFCTPLTGNNIPGTVQQSPLLLVPVSRQLQCEMFFKQLSMRGTLTSDYQSANKDIAAPRDVVPQCEYFSCTPEWLFIAHNWATECLLGLIWCLVMVICCVHMLFLSFVSFFSIIVP